MRIGVISDTHGLVRPEAVAALRDSELLLHAGDIGKPEVLETLESIAAIMAIRGNIDLGAWASHLPLEMTIEVKGTRIYLIHNVNDLTRDPRRDGYGIVISGHSHKPSIRRQNGVLFLNPGSAGPRRFKLPVTVAKLRIDGTDVQSEIVELAIRDQGSGIRHKPVALTPDP
jgi:putative phosphoesterase